MFIFAQSDALIEDSRFIYDTHDFSNSLIDLQMMSGNTQIDSFNINMSCLPWYKLLTSSNFQTLSVTGELVLQKYTAYCKSCSASFYLPTSGRYKVHYVQNKTEIQIHQYDSESKDLNCLECPYGAECPGENLKSKPNFWGYKFQKTIFFQQCPSYMMQQTLVISIV